MIAIIPARGGSKGIPQKNIKNLSGKPLILHTIDAAKAAKCFERIVVSTDDPKIREVAIKYGAEVPVLRPLDLAQDDALVTATYEHVLRHVYAERQIPEMMVALHPTSPLRTGADIIGSVKLFLEKDADAVISVCEYDHPPQWALKMETDSRVIPMFGPDGLKMNRQNLPKAYIPNGAIYVIKSSLILNQKDYYTDRTYAYIMPQERSVDIDTLRDWKLAEYWMERHE